MDFAFKKMTSIHGFTFMLTVRCKKNIILWEFPTAYKRPPVRISFFILTALKNEQHPQKIVKFDKYVTLANSTDVTNLLFDELNISMETNDGDAS